MPHTSSNHTHLAHNFATLKNTRFLDAIAFKPVDSTPVWMMRQAGRYLPEYKATRAQAGDFLSLCKNTDLACEVTLQPLKRFDLDAAILFSDILTIPDAMGLGLYFEAGEGPKFKKQVRDEATVDALPGLNSVDALDYVMRAVTAIRHALAGKVPLIGFSGSPWTLATYMIEGGSSKDFRHAKQMLYAQPEVLHKLLNKLTDAVVDYLCAQIAAGAQAVQVFDSWGGALAHGAYVEFSQQYLKRIVTDVKQVYPDVPVIVFTKGGGQWLSAQLDTGANMVGLDWTTPLDIARAQLGSSCAIQGNLDPATLYGTSDAIERATHNMLDDAYRQQAQQNTPKTGYVANLGHGISQWTDPDHAKVFIDAVRKYQL